MCVILLEGKMNDNCMKAYLKCETPGDIVLIFSLLNSIMEPLFRYSFEEITSVQEMLFEYKNMYIICLSQSVDLFMAPRGGNIIARRRITHIHTLQHEHTN